MNSTTSKKLHFVMSTEDDLSSVVRELSGVHHVVPSATPDTGLLLSVEIDDDYPDLIAEVRRIVAAHDPAPKELHESH